MKCLEFRLQQLRLLGNSAGFPEPHHLLGRTARTDAGGPQLWTACSCGGTLLPVSMTASAVRSSEPQRGCCVPPLLDMARCEKVAIREVRRLMEAPDSLSDSAAALRQTQFRE